MFVEVPNERLISNRDELENKVKPYFGVINNMSIEMIMQSEPIQKNGKNYYKVFIRPIFNYNNFNAKPIENKFILKLPDRIVGRVSVYLNTNGSNELISKNDKDSYIEWQGTTPDIEHSKNIHFYGDEFKEVLVPLDKIRDKKTINLNFSGVLIGNEKKLTTSNFKISIDTTPYLIKENDGITRIDQVFFASFAKSFFGKKTISIKPLIERIYNFEFLNTNPNRVDFDLHFTYKNKLNQKTRSSISLDPNWDYLESYAEGFSKSLDLKTNNELYLKDKNNYYEIKKFADDIIERHQNDFTIKSTVKSVVDEKTLKVVEDEFGQQGVICNPEVETDIQYVKNIEVDNYKFSIKKTTKDTDYTKLFVESDNESFEAKDEDLVSFKNEDYMDLENDDYKSVKEFIEKNEKKVI
ncbi:hypothetical protein SHELI_v1c08180 [Spiroplasma helicoides]|uniref:Uncharacterized protein n=1 Tax=Spiroplasma helicoides TaxID=216938 RepID=A0A1B3SLG7_9MOLU|nr:hypothetical protein [Spiroplasma helicoides]AOG60767.1 hypothetical protein SHELI_v1c08180 [Spiroplasma helicoides]